MFRIYPNFKVFGGTAAVNEDKTKFHLALQARPEVPSARPDRPMRFRQA